MKNIGSVVTFLFALTGLFASVLSIVDYALNKPEIIRMVFGPFIDIYKMATDQLQFAVEVIWAAITQQPQLSLQPYWQHILVLMWLLLAAVARNNIKRKD